MEIPRKKRQRTDVDASKEVRKEWEVYSGVDGLVTTTVAALLLFTLVCIVCGLCAVFFPLLFCFLYLTWRRRFASVSAGCFLLVICCYCRGSRCLLVSSLSLGRFHLPRTWVDSPFLETEMSEELDFIDFSGESFAALKFNI
jgi:hypothetical protein